MKFNENLAVVHAYLCADGYVVKNPETQKHKYYRIGLRNTNLILLKDFQKRFYTYFGEKPILKPDERCEKSSKKIHGLLVKHFGSFYSPKWQMPKLNKKLSALWLRAFFDCEGWVTIETRQNRNIGLDSINKKGLIQVKNALERMGISSKLKQRRRKEIFRIYVYGKNNLIKFQKEIGFLHPSKREKLNRAIKDYVEYHWHFPKNKNSCKNFVKCLLIERIRVRKPYYTRIISKEELNLQTLRKLIKEFYGIEGIVNRSINGLGTIYYELNINRKVEVQKLIDAGIIQNIFKQRN